MTHIEFFKAMKNKIHHKIELVMLMPLVTLLFMIQSLQFYSQGDRILLLMIAYFALTVIKDQEKEDKIELSDLAEIEEKDEK